MTRRLLALLSVAALTLTGCIAGVTYDRPGPYTGPYIYVAIEGASLTNITSVINSYPANANGGTPTPTASLAPPAGTIFIAMCGDGRGKIYAITETAALGAPTLVLHQYTAVAGVLTETGTFPGILLYVPGFLLAADPAGNVYIGQSGGGFGVFSTTGGPAIHPAYPNNFGDIWALATDASGDLYALDFNNLTIAAWSAGFNASTPPSHTFTPSGLFTGLISNIAADANGDVYTVQTNAQGTSTPYTVEAFAANATGSATPTRTITGGTPTPYAVEQCDLAVDASGNIYVVQLAPSTTDQLISVFSSTANGSNVPPANSFIMPGMFDVGIAVE